MSYSYKRFILLLVIFSIIVKIVFLFMSGAWSKPEVFEYDYAAKNLLEGRGFFYEHFNTKYYAGIAPGYPILCFLIYKVFGYNPLWIIFLQIIVSSLLVIPIFWIAINIFDKATAALAGVLVAFYPPLIIYSTTKLHSLNLYSFIFAMLVLTFLFLKMNATPKRILLTGIISGIAVLFRMTSVIFLIFALGWFYFVSQEEKYKKVKIVLSILIICFVLIAPWLVRNYIVFAKPVFFQTNKWECLWFGNMPDATGCLYNERGETMVQLSRKYLPSDFFNRDELEQGDILKGLTIAYFKQEPLNFIKKIGKKAVYFWYFNPNQGQLYPKIWKSLYKIYYFIIFVPAVMSILHSFCSKLFQHKQEAILLIMLFLTMTVSHALYYAEARHRWSIEPLILLFTANGVILLKNAAYKIIIKR